MSEHRKDGDDSGDPLPDESRGRLPEDSGGRPLDHASSRGKNLDWRRNLITVIQLLTVLAALAHEVWKLLG
ncbi:hypothetical protein SAMN04489729_0834 [Amycolatopsis lurida]|uniref:Uncharacterized protein n=1 Tax=Amycolatopsis lurida NRRL 2430 TaxID=1460371 RepID=A0A2P2FM34_AMYLU|nr:hypothetical protein [Amycolatopsis lurida]KFU77774.1 hypothetical protein BB31_29350 [Amycolatopsis lurida NRRL 2430]SEB39099.1 hypothetical protein SAMN04489729_0834 [Amycolatopsis lurida]